MLMHQDNEQYDFIMSKRALKGSTGMGSSTKSRILIVLAIAVVLLIVGSLVFGFIFKGNDKTTPNLLTIAEKQTELIRVSAIGVKKARSSTSQSYAITTQLSMQSDKTALLANLKANGKKVSEKDLGLLMDPKTDAALNNADQSNAFDDTFNKTIQEQLVSYQASVKTAYDEAQSAKTKQVLSDLYTHAGTLLKNQAVTSGATTPTTN